MALQLANFYYDEVSTSILPQSYARYVKNNDQWVVTDVDVRLDAVNVFQYERKAQGSSVVGAGIQENRRKWQRSVMIYHNASVRLVVNAKRTSSYYVFNLLAPLLVIVAISVFTAILPSESEQKPEIQLTVMLAFVFYQSVLSERVPKSDAMPLLGLYVMYAILLSAAHLMCCHLVIRIVRLKDSRPPPLLLGHFVALWLCVWNFSARAARQLRQSTRRYSKFLPLKCCPKPAHEPTEQLTCMQPTRAISNNNSIAISPEMIYDNASEVTTQEKVEFQADAKHDGSEVVTRGAAPSWEAVALCLHYTTCTLFLLLNGTLVLIFIVPLFRAWVRNSALGVYFEEIEAAQGT